MVDTSLSIYKNTEVIFKSKNNDSSLKSYLFLLFDFSVLFNQNNMPAVGTVYILLSANTILQHFSVFQSRQLYRASLPLPRCINIIIAKWLSKNICVKHCRGLF